MGRSSEGDVVPTASESCKGVMFSPSGNIDGALTIGSDEDCTVLCCWVPTDTPGRVSASRAGVMEGAALRVVGSVGFGSARRRESWCSKRALGSELLSDQKSDGKGVIGQNKWSNTDLELSQHFLTSLTASPWIGTNHLPIPLNIHFIYLLLDSLACCWEALLLLTWQGLES